jgi:hypothetical protein
MERLQGDVRRELERFGPAAGMADLVAAWPRSVGDQIARNAWPARIARDGTLHVHTSSSAWAFELAQLESTLKERLGGLAPPRLRFAVGPLPEAPRDASEDESRHVPEPSPEDLRAAADLAAGVADENLRKVVARAAALSLANARSDR